MAISERVQFIELESMITNFLFLKRYLTIRNTLFRADIERMMLIGWESVSFVKCWQQYNLFFSFLRITPMLNTVRPKNSSKRTADVPRFVIVTETIIFRGIATRRVNVGEMIPRTFHRTGRSALCTHPN